MAVELKPQTQELLRETVPGDQDLDAKVRRLIEEESLRQLGRYRRTDLALTRKYGMAFEEFLKQSVPRQKRYSLEKTATKKLFTSHQRLCSTMARFWLGSSTTSVRSGTIPGEPRFPLHTFGR